MFLTLLLLPSSYLIQVIWKHIENGRTIINTQSTNHIVSYSVLLFLTWVQQSQCALSNKRPTWRNGHLSNRDSTLTSSQELIFAYQQAHHRMNKNQQWTRKSAFNPFIQKQSMYCILIHFIKIIHNFNERMHYHFMSYKSTSCGIKFYNFNRTFLGHHYYTLMHKVRAEDIWRNDAVSLYDLQSYALA